MRQLKRGDVVTLTGDYEHSLAALSPWIVLDRWLNSAQIICYNIYRPQISFFSERNLKGTGKRAQVQKALRQAYDRSQE